MQNAGNPWWWDVDHSSSLKLAEQNYYWQPGDTCPSSTWFKFNLAWANWINKWHKSTTENWLMVSIWTNLDKQKSIEMGVGLDFFWLFTFLYACRQPARNVSMHLTSLSHPFSGTILRHTVFHLVDTWERGFPQNFLNEEGNSDRGMKHVGNSYWNNPSCHWISKYSSISFNLCTLKFKEAFHTAFPI